MDGRMNEKMNLSENTFSRLNGKRLSIFCIAADFTSAANGYIVVLSIANNRLSSAERHNAVFTRATRYRFIGY
jgi:phosphatidylserine decarboxylase